MLFLAILLLGSEAANALDKNATSPPSHEYVKQFVAVNKLSDGQLFSFILDDDLNEYKDELSRDDYKILLKESKNKDDFRRNSLIRTTKIMLIAVKEFIGDQDISDLDADEYAKNMAPVFQKIDDFNMESYQKRMNRTRSKLSISGQNFLTNVMIPDNTLSGQDLKIRWQDLAANDPVKFKNMHIKLITYLQGFESVDDIDTVYEQSKVEIEGDGIKTDQVASQNNSYRITNKKGTK